MEDAATLLDNTVRVTQYGSAHYIKIGDAGCACNALMASPLSGVSLRARHGSTQVMLGCHCGPDGTRARWDTSLVNIKVKGKGMVLYSAVSSPLDRSKRFTLFPLPDRPVHSDTNSPSLGSILAMQQLRNDYSLTCSPLSIARY